VLIVDAYVILRAANLRRVLVDRPYRSRALWTAIGGLAVVCFAVAGYLDDVFGQVPTTTEGVIVEAAIWGVAFLLLSGWIVSNINVAFTADYFNRDALLWKRGGWVVVLAAVFTGYALASLPSWWLPAPLVNSGLGTDVISVLFFCATGYCAIVLSLTYFRVQDKRIRTYTKWVVLSILSLFVYVAIPNNGASPYLAVIAGVVWAYSMFRSVSTLAIRTHTLPA
jgi:hypothetical protein